MNQTKSFLKYLFVLILLGGCTQQDIPVEEDKEQDVIIIPSDDESIEDSKELVISFENEDVNGQYKLFWDHFDQMKDKDSITWIFNEKEIYVNSDMIQNLPDGFNVKMIKDNESVVINSSDLKDKNYDEKWGHYSLDQVMLNKRVDVSYQVMPFSAIVTDIKEDGYIVRGNSSMIHPDVVIHLKTYDKEFKKGDFVDFVAPVDTGLFKEGNVEVNCIALLASKKNEKYDYRLWDEAYEYLAYYAKAGETLEIIINEDDINVLLSDFGFNDLEVDQLTLKYKDKSILWTEEMSIKNFNNQLDHVIHMPLVYLYEKIDMNTVVTIETAIIIELNENGFIAMPVEEDTFNDLEYLYVPIQLPEGMEIGEYVEITYQYDSLADNMIFWYVNWIPAPVK